MLAIIDSIAAHNVALGVVTPGDGQRFANVFSTDIAVALGPEKNPFFAQLKKGKLGLLFAQKSHCDESHCDFL
jgi:hypothetical protein